MCGLGATCIEVDHAGGYAGSAWSGASALEVDMWLRFAASDHASFSSLVGWLKLGGGLKAMRVVANETHGLGSIQRETQRYID